jgi:SAM-dependent methyltransferase
MEPFGRLFRKGRGRRLLDFGCGNGLFLEMAHRRGFDCYGVDLAADAIEVARQRLTRDLETWGGFTPNHLAFFAQDTLGLLLRRAGFGSVVMPPGTANPSSAAPRV